MLPMARARQNRHRHVAELCEAMVRGDREAFDAKLDEARRLVPFEPPQSPAAAAPARARRRAMVEAPSPPRRRRRRAPSPTPRMTTTATVDEWGRSSRRRRGALLLGLFQRARRSWKTRPNKILRFFCHFRRGTRLCSLIQTGDGFFRARFLGAAWHLATIWGPVICRIHSASVYARSGALARQSCSTRSAVCTSTAFRIEWQRYLTSQPTVVMSSERDERMLP